MCSGGGSAKAPEIKYKGPSKGEIKRQRKQLEEFQQTITAQQQAFQSQLQAQIDAANTEYAELEQQLADSMAAQEAARAKSAQDLAAAAANSLAIQSANQAAVEQSSAAGVQTTKAITDKKKPNNSLRISTNSVQATPGAGLNIGV